jgi:hypothetical protein
LYGVIKIILQTITLLSILFLARPENIAKHRLLSAPFPLRYTTPSLVPSSRVPQFPQNCIAAFSGGLSQLQLGHITFVSEGEGCPQPPQNLVLLTVPHSQTHSAPSFFLPKRPERLTSPNVRFMLSPERLKSLIVSAALLIT